MCAPVAAFRTGILRITGLYRYGIHNFGREVYKKRQIPTFLIGYLQELGSLSFIQISQTVTEQSCLQVVHVSRCSLAYRH